MLRALPLFCILLLSPGVKATHGDAASRASEGSPAVMTIEKGQIPEEELERCFPVGGAPIPNAGEKADGCRWIKPDKRAAF